MLVSLSSGWRDHQDHESLHQHDGEEALQHHVCDQRCQFLGQVIPNTKSGSSSGTWCLSSSLCIGWSVSMAAVAPTKQNPESRGRWMSINDGEQDRGGHGSQTHTVLAWVHLGEKGRRGDLFRNEHDNEIQPEFWDSPTTYINPPRCSPACRCSSTLQTSLSISFWTKLRYNKHNSAARPSSSLSQAGTDKTPPIPTVHCQTEEKPHFLS